MRTREELENLINGSPLFLIDRIKDAELFVSEKRKFLSDLADLMQLIRKDFAEIGFEIIQTAKACIKAYKPDCGAFLNYFNTALTRTIRTVKAKETADSIRGGMTLDEKTEQTICQIFRYANARGDNIHDSDLQKKIAVALDKPIEVIVEAISINDGMTVRSGNELVRGKDGFESEVFDFVAADNISVEETLVANEIVREKILLIDKLFKATGKKSQPILSKILTARLSEVFSELGLIEWVVKTTSFVDRDIIGGYIKSKAVPTAREIAAAHGVHEASASRTFNTFLGKLRGICFVAAPVMSRKANQKPREKFNVINFHVTEYCNYRCRFCFAQFMCKDEIKLDGAKRVVDNIFDYFTVNGITDGRINLAGGEPVLIKFFDELVDYINTKGIAVSIITNGSMLTPERVKRMRGKVSMLGLSIDSLDHETNLKIGRSCRGETLSPERVLEIVKAAKESGMRVKVNTVVSRLNADEDISALYDSGLIDRIKLLQMRVNKGVNDIAEAWLLNKKEFTDYCKRLEKYNVVEENDDALDASYIIINPEGNLLTNKGNSHRVLGSLLETPLGELIEGNFSYSAFSERYQKTES